MFPVSIPTTTWAATSLLARHQCDVLIHINTPTPEYMPAYGRIRGFCDLCMEKELKHQIFIQDMGHGYEDAYKVLLSIVGELEENFRGMKKGIFISNDTHANILLNILIRKYGTLPDDYKIIGFDNSPISREAIIPISTIGQQIDTIAHEAVSLLVDEMNEHKKRRPVLPDKPFHKIITPILIRRETTEGYNM